MVLMPHLDVHGARPSHVSDASAVDVMAAIQDLDGENELFINEGQAVWLGVAGGPERFLVAWVDDTNSHLYQALAAAVPAVGQEFMVGGVLTGIEPEYLVSPQDAVRACEQFLASGERTEDVQWQRM
jgi:hypothetical protein